jgi:dipeptidyl aminopeptidase/acylaminoacyl peptidase
MFKIIIILKKSFLFQGIPEVALRKLDDGSLVYLLQANAELASKLTGKNLPKRIDTRVEVADGFMAPVKILYPPHMVEGEQYPLLVYVYGGPGSQMVDDRSVAESEDFDSAYALTVQIF